MAELTYDFSALYNEFFGKAPIFKLRAPDTESTNINYSGFETAEIDESNKLSYLNTRIHFPITFSSDKPLRYDNDGKIEEVDKKEFRLSASAICEFSRAKISNGTKAVAGKGTVDEIFGFEDWQISINMVLFPDSAQPQNFNSTEEQLTQLLRYEELVSAIKVEGKMFEWLGIYEIMLLDISVSQIMGKPNVIPVSMSAKSVEPIELITI